MLFIIYAVERGGDLLRTLTAAACCRTMGRGR